MCHHTKRIETLLAVTRRLGSRSTWDAPGWTLHVLREDAEALFEAVYAFDAARAAIAKAKGETQ